MWLSRTTKYHSYYKATSILFRRKCGYSFFFLIIVFEGLRVCLEERIPAEVRLCMLFSQFNILYSDSKNNCIRIPHQPSSKSNGKRGKTANASISTSPSISLVTFSRCLLLNQVTVTVRPQTRPGGG